jgi:hypothetical protein
LGLLGIGESVLVYIYIKARQQILANVEILNLGIKNILLSMSASMALKQLEITLLGVENSLHIIASTLLVSKNEQTQSLVFGKSVYIHMRTDTGLTGVSEFMADSVDSPIEKAIN